jgi:uncharacterized repeat protein (TIGR01451 family)
MRLLRGVLIVLMVAVGLVVPAAPAGAVVAVPPLQISKSFSAPTMLRDGTTKMTLTITNPATVEQTGVGVLDVLPSSLAFADPLNLSRTCTGDVSLVTEAPFSVELNDGTIAASSSCTVSVDLNATANGLITNTTGKVSSTEGGEGNTATASITVFERPAGSVQFGALTIPLGGSTSLQFSVSNFNPLPLTGVAFGSDSNLPNGLVIANPNSLTNRCSGTVTATPGSRGVSLTDGSIPPNVDCSVTVGVIGIAAGVWFVGVQPSSTEGGRASSPAIASITVVAPPVITKFFGPTTTPLGGGSTLTLVVTNPNNSQLTGVSFTDVLPPGLNAPGVLPVLEGSCGSGVASTTETSIAIINATIPAGRACGLQVVVIGRALGPQINTTSSVVSNEGGTGAPATATLVVGSPPTINKSFETSTIKVGESTTLQFLLGNANAAPLTAAAFTDNLPTGLVIASQPGLVNTCPGTVTAVAGTGSIAVSGETIPASATCLIQVNVRATSAGTKTNTTSELTTAEGLTGTAAIASLTVVGPPTLTKAFAPSTVPVGGTTRLTFTLTNPNPTVGLSRITFSDPFPGGLAVAANPSVINTCGGVPSVGPFALAVAYANASLPPGGSCTFSVNVTAGSAGVKTNTTTIISSSAGIGSPATGTLTVNP